MSNRYDIPFSIEDRVHIDGDKSITAVVIGVLFRRQGFQLEVAWFNGGSHRTAWIDLFRLTSAEPR